MREQIIQEIIDSLNRMENAGKIDMSILDNLEKLEEFLQNIKAKWLKRTHTNAFYFYQAARNVELILAKMKDRFKSSLALNDNPKIVTDSLAVMPSINDVLRMAETNDVTNSSVNDILEKTHHMRNDAAHRNLIEPLEIDRKSIDKDSLRYNFNLLMDNLEIKSDDKYRVND